MSDELLESLTGAWEGTCRTWFEPGVLADESSVTGEFVPVLDGRFVRHTYRGTIQGKPRHGEETIAIMFSEGDATVRGFVVAGKYEFAPNAPQWGWKTVYELLDRDRLTITAFNITPDGQEAKAV